MRSTGALTTAPDENSPAANRHIVLVEEEVALRELMRQTLHGHGYLVSAAANEKALLDLISGASGKVGLVIMSLSVSWGDGPSIARLVRQWEPEVPILGLSSSSPGPESDWRLAVLEGLGIRRVLAKPFTGRALLQAVSQALAVRSTP